MKKNSLAAVSLSLLIRPYGVTLRFLRCTFRPFDPFLRSPLSHPLLHHPHFVSVPTPPFQRFRALSSRSYSTSRGDHSRLLFEFAECVKEERREKEVIGSLLTRPRPFAQVDSVCAATRYSLMPIHSFSPPQKLLLCIVTRHSRPLAFAVIRGERYSSVSCDSTLQPLLKWSFSILSFPL